LLCWQEGDFLILIMKSPIIPLFSRTAALAFSVLASCSTQSARPIANPSVLQNKKIATTTAYDAPFQAVTPGGASLTALGPVGAVAGASVMTSKGKEIISSNKVQNPSIHVTKDLANILQEKCAMKPVGTINASTTKPADFGKLAPQADYVLDVQTVMWSVVYYPANWGTYRAVTVSSCRLVDCKTGKIVASGVYTHDPKKNEQSSTYDGLLGNQAAALKRELKHSESESVQYFRSNVLKL